MDREAVIRQHLTIHQPEMVLLAVAPNSAGLWFAESDDGELLPAIHVFTFWDRTAHLSDEEFGQALLALDLLIEAVIDVTGGLAGAWHDLETFGQARSIVKQRAPDLELILAKALNP
jgi:hypothetical protein